jgi:hypothetical protein
MPVARRDKVSTPIVQPPITLLQLRHLDDSLLLPESMQDPHMSEHVATEIQSTAALTNDKIAPETYMVLQKVIGAIERRARQQRDVLRFRLR